MSNINKIIPVIPKNIDQPGYLKRSNARSDIYKIPIENIYDSIEREYRQTTAYSLSKKQYPYFSGPNSILNRISRFWNEKYIIIEQNLQEQIYKFFTILLLILTLVLIIYAKKYDLILVPSSMIKNISTDNKEIINSEEEYIKNQKELEHYNRIQKSSDVIKGISVLYLIILSSSRIFKRTTV